MDMLGLPDMLDSDARDDVLSRRRIKDIEYLNNLNANNTM